jgi:hypothetical protein
MQVSLDRCRVLLVALAMLLDPCAARAQPATKAARVGDRLPGIYEHRPFVDAGGLLSYGPLAQERFARLASYVGTRHGIDIPASLRLRADQVIE